jgi:hypothetical protein
MLFFRSKPNLGDNEKAKVEFFFFKIAQAIGADRITTNVVSPKSLMDFVGQPDAIGKLVDFVGRHLNHDVGDLQVQVSPKLQQKCGGGG